MHRPNTTFVSSEITFLIYSDSKLFVKYLQMDASVQPVFDESLFEDILRKFVNIILKARIKTIGNRKTSPLVPFHTNTLTNKLNFNFDENKNYDNQIESVQDCGATNRSIYLDVYITYEGQTYLLERWRLQCSRVTYERMAEKSHIHLASLIRALYTYMIILPASNLFGIPRNISFTIANKPNMKFEIEDGLFGSAKLAPVCLTETGTTFEIIGRYRTDISNFLKAPNNANSLNSLLVTDYFEEKSPEVAQPLEQSIFAIDKDATNIHTFLNRLDQALLFSLEGDYDTVSYPQVLDEYEKVKSLANEVLLE